MSNYFIELAIIHTSLMCAYGLFLRNESQHGKLRIYVLASALLSLVIPALRLPRLFASQPAGEVSIIPLDTVFVGDAMVAQESVAAFQWQWLIWPYLLVCLILIIRFFRSIDYMVQLERSTEGEWVNGIKVRKSADIQGSFSFFNWIFIGKQFIVDRKELDAILRHEKAHADLGHTYDLIFFELFKVVFWWLPTTWIAIKETKKIHEYQADAYAVKSLSVERYSSILISSTLKANGLCLASSFHDGLIFKRLNAMKQKAKNVSPWKIGTVTLLAATLFVAFACSEEMDKKIQEIGESSNSVSFDQLPADMQMNLAEVKEELTFIKVDIPSETSDADLKLKISDMEEFKNLDPGTIHSMNVVKEADSKAIYLALKKEGANFDYLAQQSKVGGDVFTVVEEKPEFPGGKDALMKYLISELNYPKDAESNGVEGRVMVQFVVDRDGSVTQVSAVKGIGSGCDEEAVRVISNMPNFNPGKQRGRPVAVRMLIPIVFSLTQDKASTSKEMLIGTKSDFNIMNVKADYSGGAWTGKVVNAETGKAMPGVNVVENGTSNGTVSDLDGTFTLKPSNKTNDLVLTHVGFKTSRLSTK